MASRRVGLFVAVLSVGLIFTSSAAQAEDKLYLLFFGNSFTQGFTSTGYTNVPEALANIAAADGHIKPTVVYDLQSGSRLDYHTGQVASNPTANVTSSALPVGQTWDYVVLQGYSTESTHLESANYVNEFSSDALALYQSVLDHSSGNGAGVKAIMYQTWARAPGNSFYPGNFANAAAMQAEIDASYAAAVTKINATEGSDSARLAPVGDGYAADGFSTSLYNTDLYHASKKGYYLAAMVLYRTMYNENVSDISYATISSQISNIGLTSAEWTEITGIADGLTVVPEPATMTMLVVGGIGLLARRKRRSR
jgi:hypothetical protein